jgi:tryptophan-rich sensory protein
VNGNLPNLSVAWSVFVNTLDNVGISDITLTALVLVLFCLGFLFGLLEVGRMAGLLQLGIQGGLAIGIRIVLLRSLLLVPEPTAFFVNWLLIAFCGLGSAVLVIWKQRAGLVSVGFVLYGLTAS